MSKVPFGVALYRPCGDVDDDPFLTTDAPSESASDPQGVNGSTPRPHVILEALLAPLTVIIGWAFTQYMDYVVKSGKKNKTA